MWDLHDSIFKVSCSMQTLVKGGLGACNSLEYLDAAVASTVLPFIYAEDILTEMQECFRFIQTLSMYRYWLLSFSLKTFFFSLKRQASSLLFQFGSWKEEVMGSCAVADIWLCFRYLLRVQKQVRMISSEYCLMKTDLFGQRRICCPHHRGN